MRILVADDDDVSRVRLEGALRRQSYDVVWNAPTFYANGTLASPARVTVFHNGVLVQNNVQLRGETVYIGAPFYKPYTSAPIKLQAHGDPSPPISFRNIWIREL